MRLYPMQGEVKAGLKKTNSPEQQDRPAVFDREGAEEARFHANGVGIESSLLAAYALTSIALGIDDASVAYLPICQASQHRCLRFEHC